MYIKVYTTLVLFVDLTMSPSSLNWTEHVCLCFPMKIQVMDFGIGERDNSISHIVFVKINLCSLLSNTLSYYFPPLSPLNTTRILPKSRGAESFNSRHD